MNKIPLTKNETQRKWGKAHFPLSKVQQLIPAWSDRTSEGGVMGCAQWVRGGSHVMRCREITVMGPQGSLPLFLREEARGWWVCTLPGNG